MKLIACFAAALAAGATMLPLDASAAPQTVTRSRTMTASGGKVTTVTRSDPAEHGSWHSRKHCTTSWRHHHKVRTCRKMRARW